MRLKEAAGTGSVTQSSVIGPRQKNCKRRTIAWRSASMSSSYVIMRNSFRDMRVIVGTYVEVDFVEVAIRSGHNVHVIQTSDLVTTLALTITRAKCITFLCPLK